MASLAYQVVKDFEETIAEWAGSKYAVAVESGTAAIFLSLVYRKTFYSWWGEHREVEPGEPITIPRFTYPSVPCSVIHAGFKVRFVDEQWSGIYQLGKLEIYDSAIRFHKGMYKGGLHCLSFHSKKRLAIGRGGMVLTDDEDAYKWLKKARFDGREETDLNKAALTMVGWNAYMMPEQAARGLQLFDMIKDKENPDLDFDKQGYPDLQAAGIYQ